MLVHGRVLYSSPKPVLCRLVCTVPPPPTHTHLRPHPHTHLRPHPQPPPALKAEVQQTSDRFSAELEAMDAQCAGYLQQLVDLGAVQTEAEAGAGAGQAGAEPGARGSDGSAGGGPGGARVASEAG